tara:strand:- start:445 stop:639 length:195 start_codon:yes stop_codon:yes gene_type:complete
MVILVTFKDVIYVTSVLKVVKEIFSVKQKPGNIMHPTFLVGAYTWQLVFVIMERITALNKQLQD